MEYQESMLGGVRDILGVEGQSQFRMLRTICCIQSYKNSILNFLSVLINFRDHHADIRDRVGHRFDSDFTDICGQSNTPGTWVPIPSTRSRYQDKILSATAFRTIGNLDIGGKKVNIGCINEQRPTGVLQDIIWNILQRYSTRGESRISYKFASNPLWGIN